ncbi:MAG: hypothetical protein P4L34_10895 [Paludibacter sp.]|nr:hypothetical protein [Paludibacter sp.]
MVELEQINLDADNLKGLPLFYRKIYFNQLTDWQEENKLITYSALIQADVMRSVESTRNISKTVNKKLILENNDRQ